MRGFSLIEMVAAFLVFAIAIGVLMSVLTAAMRNTRMSVDYTMAALWAQKTKSEAFAEFARQAKANAAAHAAPPAANTEEGDES